MLVKESWVWRYDGAMNWPNTIMAPAIGVVSSAWVAVLLGSRHQPAPQSAGAAICAGLAVAVFFHLFARKPNV